jgi:Tfp pilus assembly protein FimT
MGNLRKETTRENDPERNIAMTLPLRRERISATTRSGALMLYHRRGTTVAELLLTLALLGALTSIAVPRAASLVDRVSVKGATQDVELALGAARAASSRRGAYASFVADTRSGHLRVVSGGEILLDRDVLRLHGVKLEATRESVTFAPGGLGWGAANTTVIVSRGARSDTVVMSRLGRVRTAW